MGKARRHAASGLGINIRQPTGFNHTLAIEIAATQTQSTCVDSEIVLTRDGGFCLCSRDFNRQGSFGQFGLNP